MTLQMTSLMTSRHASVIGQKHARLLNLTFSGYNIHTNKGKFHTWESVQLRQLPKKELHAGQQLNRGYHRPR